MNPTSTARLLVNIDVDDLARAERFYTEAFGLTLGRRLGPTIVELLGASVPIYLLEQESGTAAFAGAAAARSYARHWSPVHLDFVVDALEPAVQRAVGLGARLESALDDQPYGRIARLADPFGHGFCLLEFNRLGYDALAT
jgi:predicted enzyme related to lactoylglutathione lyase